MDNRKIQSSIKAATFMYLISTMSFLNWINCQDAPAAKPKATDEFVQLHQESGHIHVDDGGLDDWDEDDWDEDEDVENVMARDSFVHNVEHIKAHMKDSVNIDLEMNMSPGQMDYNFFEEHDNDANGLLDGLELLNSILEALDHHYDIILKTEDKAEKMKKTAMLNTKAWLAVDRILRDADKDNDGYISWVEFKQSRTIEHNNLMHKKFKRPEESKHVKF